jgi:2-polyprenyl-3-methyl-5-hydroxy-6-metoxy-1,4-benzoquinol methylase
MKKIILTECPICNVNDWEYIDELRDIEYWEDRDFIDDQPIGFKICKDCGFLTYDYEEDKELKRRYEMIRPMIDVNCIITAKRKYMYHKQFLSDINLKGKKILDYGAGIGLSLKKLKEDVEKECVYGAVDPLILDEEIRTYAIELNSVQANYMKSEYNLNVINDISDESKYDLIMCYHVLEHMQYPDKILQQFNENLNDDGYLYLGVPENFGEVFDEASGMTTNSFENYYHLNHVNLFTKQSLRNILKKSGFKIIKEDSLMYGYSVICQKENQAEQNNILKEDYQAIVEDIKRQKKAIELYQEEKYKEAVKYYDTFVDAWTMYAAKDFKDLKRQESVLKEALDMTGNHYKIKRQLAYLYYQWDERKANEEVRITNHIKKSKELFEELIKEKPGMEDFYYYVAMIEAKYYKNYEKARQYFEKVLEINMAKYGEIKNLIGWLWKEKSK